MISLITANLQPEFQPLNHDSLANTGRWNPKKPLNWNQAAK